MAVDYLCVSFYLQRQVMSELREEDITHIKHAITFPCTVHRNINGSYKYTDSFIVKHTMVLPHQCRLVHWLKLNVGVMKGIDACGYILFCPWTLHDEDLKELLALFGSLYACTVCGMTRNDVCPANRTKGRNHECFIAWMHSMFWHLKQLWLSECW